VHCNIPTAASYNGVASSSSPDSFFIYAVARSDQLILCCLIYQGIFEKHALVVEEEVSKLRKVADSQQCEIKRLQKQLELEREASAKLPTGHVNQVWCIAYRTFNEARRR